MFKPRSFPKTKMKQMARKPELRHIGGRPIEVYGDGHTKISAPFVDTAAMDRAAMDIIYLMA